MTRWILALFALAAGTLTALARVDPAWAREAGLDFWNLGEASAQMRAEEDRTLELVAGAEHCQRRHEVLDSILARLVDGQISLAQGAEEVEQLAAADPEWFATLREFYDDGGQPTRVIVTRYLLRKLQAEGSGAEQLGQHERASLVANRLSALEAELRGPGASPPSPRWFRR